MTNKNTPRFRLQAQPDGAPTGDVFELLGNRRRRYVLYCLQQCDDPVSVEVLAEQVAAWTDDVPVDQISKKTYQSVYVSLYQSHLPKMADAGVIRYDRSEKEVWTTDRLDELNSVLNASRTRGWWQYYLLLAAVTGMIAVAAVAEIRPFSALQFRTVVLLFSFVLGGVSLIHLYYTR